MSEKSAVIDRTRSSQDIFDHADELARRFEEYEPDEANEVPVEEYLLRRAGLNRARGEAKSSKRGSSARFGGHLVGKIGEILGTSAQAAQQRYGPVVEQV